MLTELPAREELCEWGRYVSQKGLIGACEGNLSVRLSETTFVITPSGLNKAMMRPDQMVVMNLEGEVLGGTEKPSSEFRLHVGAYQARPECLAVCHAHPLTATSFGLVGMELPLNVMPEAAYILGRVGLMPFAMPGTDAVRLEMLRLAANCNTVIMANHGAVTLGKSLGSACYRMETLERIAEMIWKAKALGKLKTIPQGITERLLDRDLD